MRKQAKGTVKERMNRGSMTVEAVFVMTMLLIILMWMLQRTIAMHQQTVKTAEMQWIEISEAADRFRMIFWGQEWLP